MIDIIFFAFLVLIALILIFQVIPALVVAWGLLVGMVAVWLARKGFFGQKPGGGGE